MEKGCGPTLLLKSFDFLTLFLSLFISYGCKCLSIHGHKEFEKLRIYIVDDHKLFREGLKLLLSTQDFVHHIYEASSGRDFIENLSFVDCDLVLMDIEMPEMNGIEATEQALRIRPDLKVIVLSMYGDEQYYYKMVDVGVKGFVLKNSGIEK